MLRGRLLGTDVLGNKGFNSQVVGRREGGNLTRVPTALLTSLSQSSGDLGSFERYKQDVMMCAWLAGDFTYSKTFEGPRFGVQPCPHDAQA